MHKFESMIRYINQQINQHKITSKREVFRGKFVKENQLFLKRPYVEIG